MLGFSRDDIESTFLARYIEQRILDRSPFETIDVPGVGALVRIGAERGRAREPDIKLGICGEHGGDPDSVRVLRRGRARLRELLAVPGADRARGGRAGGDPARGLDRGARHLWPAPLRVAVVAEYYPRPSDPALGVWAHRQALAVREHGVEVRVLALERPVPPLGAACAWPARPAAASGCAARAACHGAPTLDGIPVRYVRFVSPPRPLAYATWGRWAAPRARPRARRAGARMAVRPRSRALRGAGGRRGLRWMDRRGGRLPLAVSVHGGDLSFARAARSAGARWSARPCAAPMR